MKEGFNYSYVKFIKNQYERIVGKITHVIRQGDRFWCIETLPDGFTEERNYNKSELEKIIS